MLYQILTLFPELIKQFTSTGLIKRAIEEKIVQIDSIYLRDFAINNQGQVDDTPYGGGSGMILRPEPAVAALEQAKEKDPAALRIFLTPRGKPFTQKLAIQLSEKCISTNSGLIILCGRYEGIDQRVSQHFVDLEISVGDFVLMGAEVAAMAVIEATARLLPGVLGNPDSLSYESFSTGLLEYPQYTKPRIFQGHPVPDVLLSGNHQEIEKWRKTKSLEDTQQRRPDLLRHNNKAQEIEPAENSTFSTAKLSVALVHYPVLDKQNKIITSSITNIDLHDIARSSRTFGVDRFYVIHPVKTMRRLVKKICDHWSIGHGFSYNPNRSDALELISIFPHFNDAVLDIEARCGQLPKLIVSSARPFKNSISFRNLRKLLNNSNEHYLLLLGTGWGLAEEITSHADYLLEPIYGPTDYNHLSVRGAAAIMLDRLLGVTND